MTFESLEDNFQKKVIQPLKTDVQNSVEKEKQAEDEKPTYEASVKKNTQTGLAALFQEKIKKSLESEQTTESTFMSTDNSKYGDNFTDATNYIDEQDIQKYKPGDNYNDSIVEPDFDKTDFTQRHSPSQKYDDNLQFEPQVASESDVQVRSSISNSVNADSPYSEEEIKNKIDEHNKKKKQFSENTWTPTNSYNSGHNMPNSGLPNNESKPTFEETELTEDDYNSTTISPKADSSD